jgi:DNA-binding transcriptional MerR regulator
MFVTFHAIHYGAAMLASPTPTVTAAELVELLNRIAIDPAKTGERLKHWARIGLLEPTGEQFPGTGRHRRYDFDSVTVAAVLTALSDMRVTVIGMEGALARAMGQAQKARRRWRLGNELYFVIPAGRRKGGRLLKPDAFVHEGPWEGLREALSKLSAPVTVGMVVLHLHDIFDMLSREEVPHGH